MILILPNVQIQMDYSTRWPPGVTESEIIMKEIISVRARHTEVGKTGNKSSDK